MCRRKRFYLKENHSTARKAILEKLMRTLSLAEIGRKKIGRPTDGRTLTGILVKYR